jgi:NADH-quinone oxidoreductase subunit J
VIERIGFIVIAAVMLVSAFRVVTAKNLVHGVLWLALTLSTTAVLFVSLDAAFLAGIQLLLYTGGVITLMLFGVMLTRRHDGLNIDNESAARRRLPGFVVAAALFALLVAATVETEAPERQGSPDPVTAQQIGESFLTQHLLAFEVLSLLLLAAMIGAIVLARRRDYGLDSPRIPRKGED